MCTRKEGKGRFRGEELSNTGSLSAGTGEELHLLPYQGGNVSPPSTTPAHYPSRLSFQNKKEKTSRSREGKAPFYGTKKNTWEKDEDHLNHAPKGGDGETPKKVPNYGEEGRP